MIQQGAMFGGEGPIMQGTWYNPKTNDAFTVRDSFFEDNQYTVATTDGRYLRYDQLQNYIQTDMKLEDLKKAKNNAKQHEDPLPAEVSNLIDNTTVTSSQDNLILPEDAELIYGKPKLGNIYETGPQYSNNTIISDDKRQPAVSVNRTIIEKALNNTEMPKITVGIDWNNFPSKQFEMLYEIMQIPENEIVEWYLDNIQMTELVEQVQAGIKNRIINKDNPVVDTDADNTTFEIEPKEIKPKRGRRPSNK